LLYSSRADGFRGLILNQTTSEDALRILGKPATDKTDRLDVSKISTGDVARPGRIDRTRQISRAL
jgi:hypothetical protein